MNDSTALDSNSPHAPMPSAPDGPIPLTVQWNSGGETHIPEDHRDEIRDIVDSQAPGTYKAIFPMYDSWGHLNLHRDGYTLMLYLGNAAYVVGELVDPRTARAKSLPASGTVDISRLPPEAQDAIMTLLQGAKRSKATARR